jgi:uncharacterized protein
MKTWRAFLRVALPVLIAALLASTEAHADKAVPYLSGRVVDDGHMLSQATRDRLESTLAGLEKETTDQVAVLTVDSLDGEAVDTYSVRVAHTWQLGQKGKDNGILLLVSRQDHKLRLEVGYGLEGSLTDLQSREILDDVIRPRFQQGDFDGGVEAGVGAVIKLLHGQPLPQSAVQSKKDSPGLAGLIVGLSLFTVVIGTFSFVALAIKGPISWFLYVFLVPFYLAFPAAFVGPLFAGILTLAWLIIFPIVKALSPKKGWFSSSPSQAGFWSGLSSSSMGSGGSSSGGSSDGGFSGGGGDFGGGGASGGW